MSLDNALRNALLQEGDAIPADVGAALPGIHGRVRARRRRLLGEAVAAAIVVTAVVWAPPTVRTSERGPEVTPAERQRDSVERRDPPAPRRAPAPGGSETRTGPEKSPAREPGLGRPADPPAEPAGARSPRRQAPSRSLHVPSPTTTRRVTERYDVRYVAGTHVGENAGTGCPKGRSATGSNDCIPIQIGHDETEAALRLVDDAGNPVGATVYHHAGGQGVEIASFCGRTGYFDVEPGALLLVYVDTSDRCSTQPPRTGTLVALIR